MKKNQSGVSMISLVITIVVIIILASVTFNGSRETISKAGFSSFVTEIDTVKTAFVTESIPQLIGKEARKNNAVSEAQAYNYLAKGATTSLIAEYNKKAAWFSRAQAAAIPCTRIEKESAKEAIGIELPKRTVNTFDSTGVEMSYFITNKGDIFVWPPFASSDDGLFYINATETVKTSSKYSALPNTQITTENEEEMYKNGFTFVVNGVDITVNNNNINSKVSEANPPTAETLKSNISVAELLVLPGIYYKDKTNAESPEGIESKLIYQSNSNEGATGVDKIESN